MNYAKDKEWRSFCRENYVENSKERRIWKDTPYPTLYSYVKNNYQFLKEKFKKQKGKNNIEIIEMKQISLF